jgi:hypothetical protein
VACGCAALALAAAGCGSQTRTNAQRPQAPSRVSVTINDKGVIVQPRKIAFRPEPTQQIPQNQDHPQPPIRKARSGALNTIFVIANQTHHRSVLEIHGTGGDVDSAPLTPSSSATFQTELRTGKYYVTADGVPASGTFLLFVGPYRASSQNDVLLP